MKKHLMIALVLLTICNISFAEEVRTYSAPPKGKQLQMDFAVSASDNPYDGSVGFIINDAQPEQPYMLKCTLTSSLSSQDEFVVVKVHDKNLMPYYGYMRMDGLKTVEFHNLKPIKDNNLIGVAIGTNSNTEQTGYCVFYLHKD